MMPARVHPLLSGSPTESVADRLARELARDVATVIERHVGELVADRDAYLARHTLIDAFGAARLLGVKESWIRDRTAAGTLPVVRLGALRRYHPPTLVRWALDNQETPSRPDGSHGA